MMRIHPARSRFCVALTAFAVFISMAAFGAMPQCHQIVALTSIHAARPIQVLLAVGYEMVTSPHWSVQFLD